MADRGLGTPATRAQIIEGLIAEQYLHREGRELIPSAKAFSLITLLNSAPSSSSEVTSVTMSRNSISCSRDFFIFSTNCVLCRATDACVVMASSRFRSSSENIPFFLFSTWMTPMMSPLTVRTGAQRIFRVRNPVCSSTLRLKRSSL